MVCPDDALVPGAIQDFGDGAELNDEIVREIFRFDLAALLAPQPDQSAS